MSSKVPQYIEFAGMRYNLTHRIYLKEAAELGIYEPARIKTFSCAFYFARCAHMAIETYASQVSYEGDTDATLKLRDLLESIMRIYGESSVQDVMEFMPVCRRIAFKKMYPWNPRFQAWLDSGGHSYDEMTREPGAINQ